MILTRQEKLEYISQHYMKLMYSKAYSVVSNAAEAEDACQEAFVRIIKNIDKIEDVTEIRVAALCATIAKNAAIDLYRKKSKEVVTEEFPEDSEGDLQLAARSKGPEAEVEEREAVIRLLNLIAGLPETYRDVLRLRCLNQLSAAETAELLGITENTVNIRLTRARKLLKEKLKEEKV